MTWLVTLVCAGTVYAAPRPLTELERCAQALGESAARDWDQRRAEIADHDHYAELALARMVREQHLTQADRAAHLRAELKLGAVFAREGLVNEAIYRTFIARYEALPRALEALANVRHLTDETERGLLIGEIIERILQFIPEVDLTSVADLTARARALNLTPAELRAFYDRWVVYDADDGFALLLQGAVRAMLINADLNLRRDVEARHALTRRWFKRPVEIALPRTPRRLPGETNARRVATEDVPYFATDELLAYLEASSAAARQYFLASRWPYFDFAQLTAIETQADRWRLKPSLRRTLAAERGRREARRAQQTEIGAAGARARELRRVLARFEGPKTYDRAGVQAEVGRLWRLTQADEIGAVAGALLDRVGRTGTPAQFTGLVVSVRDATLSRVGGRAAPTQSLIAVIVARANDLGLDDAEFRKVQGVLLDWAERLPAGPRADARTVAARLERATATLPPLTLPAAREQLQRTLERIDALTRQLDAMVGDDGTLAAKPSRDPGTHESIHPSTLLS